MTLKLKRARARCPRPFLGDELDQGDGVEGVDDAARRPVDLVGLLEIAHRNGMSEGGGVSVVEALRPDGTTRRFAFGSVTARTAKEHDDD